jgi:hypothetical protein
MSRGKTSLGTELEHAFEIEQYIRALGSSSSRVRFVMLALIVSSIAALATVWGGRTDGWARHRLTTAAKNGSLIRHCFSWKRFGDGSACARDLDDRDLLNQDQLTPREQAAKDDILYHYGVLSKSCSDACAAVRWFERYGINTKEDAEIFTEKQQEAFINDVLNVRTPVLGLVFDINDLGLITGLTFSILMLVMVFYTHRAHENLVLCMWKVQDIAEREQCFDQPGSKANLLYHALSMEQVFTIPPTLARWDDLRPFRRAHYLLFVTPLVVQGVVFGYDLYTAKIGYGFSQPQTKISLVCQAVFILIVLALAVICCAHLHADDTTWDRAFLFINPAHRFKGKARWWEWVHFLKPYVPGWGLVCKKEGGGNFLYFSDSIYKSVWALDVNRGEIQLYRRHKWRGLYVSKNEGQEVKGYSTARTKWHFKQGISDSESIEWSASGQGGRPPGYETLVDFSSSYNLEISDTRVRVTGKHNSYKIEVGGARGQADGRLHAAGFESINAVLAKDYDLFMTDGAWVRKVDSKGEVTTWGGKPLGEVLRQQRPLLLGMELVEREIVSRTGKLASVLLVCDFSLRRVIGVRENEAREVYRSEPGWSPSGICLDGDDIVLLEYRASRFSGEPYLRILKLFNCDFTSKPIFVYELTHAGAKLLLREIRPGAA